ncbi:gamma-glutamyl-gamma-aminobutyrate hydrolase family protein [Geomonas sp. RF6]|uniref:gamma-glutamyl-gamma-aminobutyrate hydrolase family protein n=1 Tax=Geomonas sp. RF6 TaxID=2897342 RepID=UPI001E4B2645|nr:gamma-glutamyl-gamma-aminobutyrate hydrolase family protein [Geomonas sp. RF6]UFS72435.1 gamma-glutamyl-gamma-aminobutyrate hydrolase family protein [Geomonas sp. RF6]
MKKIALTQRLVEVAEYPETRDALDLRWGPLCHELGVLPVILPTGYDFLPYFEKIGIDGVVLTGGNDLSCCSGSPLSARRDDFEKRLLACAIERGVPVVGICRGMQLIGDYFGASLQRVAGHTGGARHGLTVDEESRYGGLLRELGPVNSYHSYALTDVPEPLLVVARSEDGVVEAVQHRELPVFGQMWHSEREGAAQPAELALLTAALRLEGV